MCCFVLLIPTPEEYRVPRRRRRRRRRSLFVFSGYYEEEEEERRSLFVFIDTVEGPRAPAVKLTAHHSSLTRVRAVTLQRPRP